jgi:hypothetical protein
VPGRPPRHRVRPSSRPARPRRTTSSSRQPSFTSDPRRASSSPRPTSNRPRELGAPYGPRRRGRCAVRGHHEGGHRGEPLRKEVIRAALASLRGPESLMASALRRRIASPGRDRSPSSPALLRHPIPRQIPPRYRSSERAIQATETRIGLPGGCRSITSSRKLRHRDRGSRPGGRPPRTVAHLRSTGSGTGLTSRVRWPSAGSASQPVSFRRSSPPCQATSREKPLAPVRHRARSPV